jgi:Calcium-activated chloride channel
MNTIVFSEKRRIKPIIISVLISLGFLAVSVGISLLILYITEVLWKSSQDISAFSKALLTYGGPGVNYILARQLMKIHTVVAIRRTTLENWDTAERFEQSLILKTYFFNFFNLFNSFFIIGLFKPLFTYFREEGFTSEKLFVQCRSFYKDFEINEEV